MNGDTIFIEGLRVQGKHGVSPEERTNPQDFSVDVRASFDTRKSSVSDELSDTLDYGRFREVVRSVVEGESVFLMERLAERIANGILEDSRIKEVTITLRKLSIYNDCIPGISIYRQRT